MLSANDEVISQAMTLPLVGYDGLDRHVIISERERKIKNLKTFLFFPFSAQAGEVGADHGREDAAQPVLERHEQGGIAESHHATDHQASLTHLLRVK